MFCVTYESVYVSGGVLADFLSTEMPLFSCSELESLFCTNIDCYGSDTRHLRPIVPSCAGTCASALMSLLREYSDSASSGATTLLTALPELLAGEFFLRVSIFPG